jgi:hypothetical protein
MSNLALFAVGTGVTLLVVAALALLVWGAVMDGQYEREQQHEEGVADAPHDQLPALHVLDAA